MARRRRTKKPNTTNDSRPNPPPPVHPQRRAAQEHPAVVYIPHQRQEVLRDLGTGWSFNAPRQDIPRAPRGANSAANMAWSHNGGTGMKGWAKSRAEASFSATGCGAAAKKKQPVVLIDDGYGRRPPLVETGNGREGAQYEDGPTRAPPMWDFFDGEEPGEEPEEASGEIDIPQLVSLAPKPCADWEDDPDAIYDDKW
ncbi:hypothetical protein EDC01DRAFT_790554 [Geopyxis carbonaria]|nr:hypothetical protein EDC01DRAFT_790554 [Geopyxis carbonaria]